MMSLNHVAILGTSKIPAQLKAQSNGVLYTHREQRRKRAKANRGACRTFTFNGVLVLHGVVALAAAPLRFSRVRRLRYS